MAAMYRAVDSKRSLLPITRIATAALLEVCAVDHIARHGGCELLECPSVMLSSGVILVRSVMQEQTDAPQTYRRPADDLP